MGMVASTIQAIAGIRTLDIFKFLEIGFIQYLWHCYLQSTLTEIICIPIPPIHISGHGFRLGHPVDRNFQPLLSLDYWLQAV